MEPYQPQTLPLEKLDNALCEHAKDQVRELTHSQHSTRMVDVLFERPIDLCERLNIKKLTLRSLITQLLGADIIVTLREGTGRRPATLVFSQLFFSQLLSIVEGRGVVQATSGI